MSDYQVYLDERDRINDLVQEGYKIMDITENLSGAFVTFVKVVDSGLEKEILHITTAEGRKYFSVILINQQSEKSITS